ncbi:hypothetical protein FRC01_008204 [Tulasnella sp. 417]|nr:hypothetical protein FRC01_008204 [Tulasnella sp. 417]
MDFTSAATSLPAPKTMDSLPLELKIAIFEYLRKEDLLSSALVCRAWRDIAWDKVMWQTFMIRSSGLLEVILGKEDEWWKVVNGDFIPLTSDSNRFLAVAAKTRSIDLDVTLVDSFVNVLMDVAESAPGKVLFPSLHTLDWGEFEEPQGDIAHTVFAGSPIKKIRIDGGYFESTAVPARRTLSSFLEAHPQLQDVTAYEGNLPKGNGIPEFWQLKDLRSLNYQGWITLEEWIKLIQECPRLNDVRLDGFIPDVIPPNPGLHLAPALRRLTLGEDASFDLTVSILESIEAPHLIALDFDAEPDRLDGRTEHPSESRARSAFRLLAQRSRDLKSLNFNTMLVLRAEVLAAFSSLRRLRVREYTPGCQLDDSSVELLCRSLPQLWEFHWSYFDEDYAKITPKSFGSFARHCPDLAHLALPVTATRPEDFAGSTLRGLVAFRETLRRLEFIPLTLLADHTKDFVSFLIVQCPNLTKLDISELNIADREIPSSALIHMQYDMRDAYFQAQLVL